MTTHDRIASGYRHVYLEGMEEASIFVHVAVSDRQYARRIGRKTFRRKQATEAK